MTTFEPVNVNVGLGLSNFSAESTTPTTPRAPKQTPMQPSSAPPLPATGDTAHSAPNTPTRSSFSGMNGQRPLPSSPFSNTFPVQRQPLGTTRPGLANRGDSERSAQSVESQDIEMEDSDDGDGGSDGESVDGETGRSSKKKKGQRFFCMDYPPCKLSFTRSEHLARHIRKHTGERPFQCHCSRRFSRLDNLRQHAQTVHVNEEIPGDSLAATGTRFQRQIRTDRVRPQGNRARAGTGGSQSGPVRGHSRGLSASSIGSTTSTMSRDDARRRPPPLLMANDSPSRNNRLSLDTLRREAQTPPGQYSFLVDDEASTPTSTTYSTGQNSPGGYGSSLGSPSSAISRNGGVFENRSSHGHARRLSVPSGPLQYGSSQTNIYGSPYLSPLVSSNASAFSNLSSTFGSPTNAHYNIARSQAAIDAEIRRRTWHPSTYTFTSYSRARPTSGLFHQHSPDPPRPGFAPQATLAPDQPHRLPGIETFDQMPRRPATPPPRGSSPMQIDPAIRPPVYHGPSVQPNPGPHDRRGHASWDMSLHQNLNKLDIANGPPPPPETNTRNQQNLPSQLPSGSHTFQAPQAPPVLHQDIRGHENGTPRFPPANPNRARRQGMYIGHVAPVRNSPGDSSSSEGVPTTPSGTHAEHHPSIVHSNGYVEATGPAFTAVAGNNTSESSRPTTWPLHAEAMHPHPSGPKDTQMSGLEVLVAVAENERNATAAQAP